MAYMVARDLRGEWTMALGTDRLPLLAKFGSKLVVQIVLSIASTVIGGYLLAQIHAGSASAPPAQPTPPTQQTTQASAAANAAASDDRPTVREDRAAMRQLLKARRENSEPPATVKPKVAAAPAPLPPAMDSIATNEPVEHAAAPARASVPAVPRPRPEPRPEVADYVPAPPPGLPQAPVAAPSASQPTPITPVAPVVRVAPPAPAPVATAPTASPPAVQVAPAAPVVANATPIAPPAASALPAPAAQLPGPQVVTAPPDPATQPQEPPRERGPVGAVFSTLSGFVGHAANATGHTVNWVIDLPGKAIQAGSRVIGGDDTPPPPAPPPPARPFS
jgi:hypothetical protein